MRRSPLLHLVMAATICASLLSTAIQRKTRAHAIDPPPTRVEFRRAEWQATPGFTQRKVERENQSVFVHDEADFAVTATDIDKVNIEPDERKLPSVIIVFSQEGADRMGRLTGSQVGKPLAILVDGKLVSAPTIRSRITRVALISGRFTQEEAERIAGGLRPR
jgi:preprotein translocase subunit SecD